MSKTNGTVLQKGTLERINLTVPLEDCPLVSCQKCGNQEFLQAQRIRKISGLVNSSGETRYKHEPCMVCVNCKEVLQSDP